MCARVYVYMYVCMYVCCVTCTYACTCVCVLFFFYFSLFYTISLTPSGISCGPQSAMMEKHSGFALSMSLGGASTDPSGLSERVSFPLFLFTVFLFSFCFYPSRAPTTCSSLADLPKQIFDSRGTQLGCIRVRERCSHARA